MALKRTKLVSLAVGVACAAALPVAAQKYETFPSTKNGEWPHYTADLKGTKYSPLDQVNAQNFNKLEVAWRFKTDNLGTRPEYKLEGTPLMVKGRLYVTAGTRRSVICLDGKTGELIWTHSYREGNRAAIAPRQLSGRGVAYWTDGKGDDRIVYVTTGYRMIALRAKDGSMIESFGKGGVVDLKEGVVFGTGQQIDLETGEIGLHSTPTISKDVVMVGSAMKEGFTPRTMNNTKGLARGFDVKTGKLLWTFHTIPRPGEFGHDTWLNNSWAKVGNVGVWTQITVDEESNTVFLPVETPTNDFYGGERPGDNLFSESLVAVDLKTGKRKWHFQFVHHAIWDHDMSSAPIIADITVDGKPVKAVAVPSKQGWLYVFDRITGKPVWPIEERPVPKGDVPGEWYAPTQPFVTKPPAYSRTYVHVPDDVIDFTPELRKEALENLKRYKVVNSPYVPYILGDEKGLLGTLNIANTSGGTNWPGAGYDPETRTFFTQASNSSVTLGSITEPPPDFGDSKYMFGVKGRQFREMEGPGFGSAADAPQRREPARPAGAASPPPAFRGVGPQGLLLVKPPYGVMAAIQLDKGDLIWQVPHGDTPDGVRNHPALKGLNIPKTGQTGSVGVLVTKTLVIAGDPQVTTMPDRPRGAMMRAYDKASGKEVGAVHMPTLTSGSPMTYSIDGRQYIVIAVSGGAHSGEYIAFALPQEENATHGSQSAEARR
jgi:quinoprotein glucose dehydrogenase